MQRSAARPSALNKSATATSSERGLAIWLLQPEPARRSPLDQVLVEACRPAGGLLLGSKTPDDFEQNLLVLLEDKPAAQGNYLLIEALSSLDIDSEPLGSEVRPQVREFLGTSAEGILVKALPLMEATFGLLQDAYGTLEVRSAGAAQRDQASTIGHHLDLLDLPPSVYLLVVDATLGNFALMALIYAIQRGVRVPDWLATLGAAKYVAGLRSTLRLLGSVPGAKISRRLLPLAERLPLEDIEQEYAEGKLGLRLLALKDRAEGQSISFPFGGPVDDD